MQLWSDDRAVAVQVGAIILFAFVVIAIAGYQASVVPDQNNEIEFNHNQRVQGQMQDIGAAIDSTPAVRESRTVTADLSTEYPSRTLFVNPPRPTGRLETVGTEDPRVAVEVRNASATNPDVADFWTGDTRNYSSGAIAYAPNYNVYNQAPTTVIENSLVYNVFPDGAKLRVNSQSVFDGEQISIVTLRGTLQEQGGTASVNVRPVSASTKTVTVEGTNTGQDNVTVSIVSRLSAQQWRSILEEDSEFYNQSQGGHVASVSENGTVSLDGGVIANVIEFEMEEGETYRLQLARAAVGQLSAADRTTNASYVVAESNRVTTDEGVDVSVTFEVRDQYNNPKSGVMVNATVDGSNGNIVDSPLVTDEDGKVTFTYDTTGNVDGDAKEDTVRVSFRDDTWSLFDANAPENATTDVVVKNTDGSGQGSGGNYDLAWDLEYIQAQNTVTQCYASNVTCVYNISQTNSNNLDLRVNTTPPTTEVFVDFGHNDSSVVDKFNPSEGPTDANGYGRTTLSFENGDPTGTLRLLASAIEDPERMTLKVVGEDSTGNTPPTADFTYSPTNPQPSEQIDFTDQSSDPDGSINSYDWNFGDGPVNSTEQNPSHTYSSAGTYTVILTVTDDAGDSASYSQQVSVQTSGPSSADQISKAGEAASGNGNTAQMVTFDLQNTGSSTVEVTKISVDSTTGTATRVNNKNGDTVSGTNGGTFVETISIGGSTVTLDSSESIPGSSTTTITLTDFQKPKDSGTGYESSDMAGEEVFVTVYYADGSSEQFKLIL